MKLWLLLIAKDHFLFEYLSYDLVCELHCSLSKKQWYLIEASVMHSYRKIQAGIVTGDHQVLCFTESRANFTVRLD